MSSNVKAKPGLSLGLIALLVSVALNGLLFGLLLAGGKASPADQDMPQQRVDRPERDQHSEWRRDFKAHMKMTNESHMQDAILAHREARKRLNAIIISDAASPEEIQAAMADIRAKRNTMAKIGDESILSFLSTLPPEQRKTALRALQPKSERRGQRRGRRGETKRPRP